jgi:hypothetical protein
MTKQQKMFALVERWRRSGLSKAEFARNAGVSLGTFHYWFRRCQQEPASSPPTFVEVIAESMPGLPTEPSDAQTPRLRLEFPDGLIFTLY